MKMEEKRKMQVVHAKMEVITQNGYVGLLRKRAIRAISGCRIDKIER
jgi:hypothetical protein